MYSMEAIIDKLRHAKNAMSHERKENGSRDSSPPVMSDANYDGSADSGVIHVPELLTAPQSSEQRNPQVETAVTAYLEDVQALNVVSGVLFGANPAQGGAYVWNVFAEDVSLRDDRDFAPYENLNELARQLRRSMRGVVPLRVSHVNPSQVPALQEDCKRQKIQTELVPLR